MKLCLHLSYIAQNSFHFDEIFHRKFKISISVCVALRRHLVAILGTFGAKIDLSLLKKANSRLSLLICSKRNSNTQFSFCCSSIKIMSSNFERKHPISPESRKYQIKALKFFKLDFSWREQSNCRHARYFTDKKELSSHQEKNILYALKTRFSNLD